MRKTGKPIGELSNKEERQSLVDKRVKKSGYTWVKAKDHDLWRERGGEKERKRKRERTKNIWMDRDTHVKNDQVCNDG